MNENERKCTIGENRLNEHRDSSPTFTLAEFALVAIGIVGLLVAQLLVTHARSLFHQTPWLDEVHTLIVVNDPDPAVFRAAMSNQCVDANFPVYNWLLRTLHITSAERIREFSFASTAAALLGIYLLLRGIFSRVASAAGVLTVWTCPLVVYHSFQSRFYAPWLAAVIWFAVARRWQATTRFKAIAAVAVAITSIFGCTLHVIGLPAIGLIVLAEFLVDSAPVKNRIISALPALAGAIAVAVFVPVMLAQRRSFTIPTWLTGNPIRLLYSTIGGILPAMGSAILITGFFISAWIDRKQEKVPDTVFPSLAPTAGISALLLLPLLLFVVSLLLQPMLISRYVLVSAAAFAPAAALVAARMRRCIAITICVVLALESGAELTRRVREEAGIRMDMDKTLAVLRADSAVPILGESRHQLYTIAWLAPDLRDRCAYVDWSPGANQLDPRVEGAERDVARKFEHLYGWPHVMPWETVMSQPRFILLSLDDDVDRIARRFDGFRVEMQTKQRYMLRRK
jgi:hypothetical protein